MTAARAAALIVDARARGLDITLRDGRVRLAGEGDAPAGLLDRLRAVRADVVRVLAGDACVCCGAALAWPNADAVVFGTGEAACLSCYERWLCRHPSYWRAQLEPLDAAQREAVADEGVIDHGDVDHAVIAEARALADITRSGQERAGNESLCDCSACVGGNCSVARHRKFGL